LAIAGIGSMIGRSCAGLPRARGRAQVLKIERCNRNDANEREFFTGGNEETEGGEAEAKSWRAKSWEGLKPEAAGEFLIGSSLW